METSASFEARSAPSSYPTIRALARSGVPVVCLDRIPEGMEVDSVSVDNLEGARSAVRHMIALGHRRIAVMAGPPSLQNAVERLKVYREAMREAGTPICREAPVRTVDSNATSTDLRTT